jgi:hypothetical protein
MANLFLNALNSEVIIILGEYGKGKTLSAIALALLRAILKNRNNILTNTPLHHLDGFFNIEFLSSTKQLEDIKENTEVIFDEIHRDLNSRNSMSKHNAYITNWIVNLRKMNIGITATTQYANTIDKRLWDLCDYKIIPKFINFDEKLDKPENFQIQLYITDIYSNEIEIVSLNLEKFKDLYDTKYKPLKLVANHSDMFIGKGGKKYALELLKKGLITRDFYEKVIMEDNTEN